MLTRVIRIYVVQEMFSSMDLDSNGKISLYEYIAAVCGRGWLDDAGFDAATRKEIEGHLQDVIKRGINEQQY